MLVTEDGSVACTLLAEVLFSNIYIPFNSEIFSSL